MSCFCLYFTSSRNKIDPRAHVCIFIGYHAGMKGSKLYNLKTKQSFISWDVIFQEHLFPLHSIVHESSMIDPFPNLVLPNPPYDTSMDLHPPIHNPNIISPSPLHDSTITTIPRRSCRSSKPPSYLRDFHCNLTTPIPSLFFYFSHCLPSVKLPNL